MFHGADDKQKKNVCKCFILVSLKIKWESRKHIRSAIITAKSPKDLKLRLRIFMFIHCVLVSISNSFITVLE